MAIDPKFLIDRQGKSYALFAGLLDAAHKEGLASIDTELLQVPSAENGEVAICKAVVTMLQATDSSTPLVGMERKFSGIGDASPENVGRGIVVHRIRMAETRAKARALRDAVNVGVTALEETGEEDAPRPAQGHTTAPGGSEEGEEGVRDGQVRKIRVELNKGGYAEPVFVAKHGPIEQLTKRAASDIIDRLVKANEANDG